MMKDEKEVQKLIVQITKQMDFLINDVGVPRNVRSAVTEAREKLNTPGEYVVRVSEAIYNLDSVSNDINLPQQARTSIWSILSMLESIKVD
jgi:uncharacterized protein